MRVATVVDDAAGGVGVEQDELVVVATATDVVAKCVDFIEAGSYCFASCLLGTLHFAKLH